MFAGPLFSCYFVSFDNNLDTINQNPEMSHVNDSRGHFFFFFFSTSFLWQARVEVVNNYCMEGKEKQRKKEQEQIARNLWPE